MENVQNREAISYLKNMIDENKLKFDINKLDGLFDYIFEEIKTNYKDINIYDKIKTLSINDIKQIINSYKSFEEENKLITLSFEINKRIELKNKLINLEKDLELDKLIEISFEKTKKNELKSKLKRIEQKTIIKKYFSILSVAATTLFILFVMIPIIEKNYTINEYSKIAGNIEQDTYQLSKKELYRIEDGLRGNDFAVNNYSDSESAEIFEAINLINIKEYNKAYKILKKCNISKEKNPELTLFFAITQIKNNQINDAILNLEYLNKIPDFILENECKYELANAYIQRGEYKKARKIIKEIENNN